MGKNLIPLAFRPLRLVMTAAQLRDVRIVLLKTCHLPHVMAIQAYEAVRGWARGRKPGSLPFGSGPNATTPRQSRQSKRYSRTNRLSTPQPLAADYLKPAVLMRDAHDGASSNEDNTPNATDVIHTLEATVARLARQVEDLTRAVASKAEESCDCSHGTILQSIEPRETEIT